MKLSARNVLKGKVVDVDRGKVTAIVRVDIGGGRGTSVAMEANEETIAETCPACGKPAECGMARGETTCWCFALPHVLPMTPEGRGAPCYCPRCLQRLIDDRMARITACESE